jgi:hypothetical protein
LIFCLFCIRNALVVSLPSRDECCSESNKIRHPEVAALMFSFSDELSFFGPERA